MNIMHISCLSDILKGKRSKNATCKRNMSLFLRSKWCRSMASYAWKEESLIFFSLSCLQSQLSHCCVLEFFMSMHLVLFITVVYNMNHFYRFAFEDKKYFPHSSSVNITLSFHPSLGIEAFVRNSAWYFILWVTKIFPKTL